jgi:gliotoxin/aspirochlorine biosynthesis aminotransferase
VNIICANSSKFSDALTSTLIPALESAYLNAPDPKRIKGLVVSNPHNPFAQCYPKDVLLECLKFCKERGLYYVSDEIYALSVFETPTTKGNPFVSALSLMNEVESEGDSGKELIDRSRVHLDCPATFLPANTDFLYIQGCI